MECLFYCVQVPQEWLCCVCAHWRTPWLLAVVAGSCRIFVDVFSVQLVESCLITRHLNIVDTCLVHPGKARAMCGGVVLAQAALHPVLPHLSVFVNLEALLLCRAGFQKCVRHNFKISKLFCF